MALLGVLSMDLCNSLGLESVTVADGPETCWRRGVARRGEESAAAAVRPGNVPGWAARAGRRVSGAIGAKSHLSESVGTRQELEVRTRAQVRALLLRDH